MATKDSVDCSRSAKIGWKSVAALMAALLLALAAGLLASCSPKDEGIASFDQLNQPGVKIGVASDSTEFMLVEENFPQTEIVYTKDLMSSFEPVFPYRADGSAKFITSFFRAPDVTDAVRELLANDGLILGICNGFQALVKLGLVPFGDIRPMDDTCPTLTFNTIGRHQAKIVRTRVASTLSSWLSKCAVGDMHSVPISHGEGRFVASEKLLATMALAGWTRV